MKKARILLFDIETSHLKADFGTLLAFGYKWFDEKRIYVPTILDFEPDSAIDDLGVVTEAHRVLGLADVIVTYYGKGFDTKFLNSKFLEHGLPILANIPHIDLFFTVKSNLSLSRKSLANFAYFANLEATKTPVEGRLWKQAMIGDKGAIKYVKDHCRADVQLLEETYLKLRPLVRQHPRVAGPDTDRCPACGGTKAQRRGLQYTTLQKPKQRLQCTERRPSGEVCGSWYTLPLDDDDPDLR